VNTIETTKLQLRFHAPMAVGGQLIGYAIGACCIGELLVARGARGICAIFLDDTPEGLRNKLHEAFPDSTAHQRQDSLQDDLDKVRDFIDSADGAVTLEIDAEGSAFQQRVWKLLREIPAGSTLSYSQVAERLGRPSAARAVASACAANKHAVVIPCHRVVRGDGSVSGYRWGADRKRRLLLKESRR
jgi:AraC family transcriptional regulator, regulatory protein of adaptative response / methylated-DNA-[protein]-cysteine methyltransferase